MAERSGAQLFFEAAVGGGIPVIKTLRESLAGNAIRRVSGILNGTCNYILSRMETEHLPFEVCLSEAQKLGYAEADPTFDVGGFDTAHKLAILASLAFGAKIDAGAVSVEGIETITLADLSAADELGFRIKLLGRRRTNGPWRRAAGASDDGRQERAARPDHGRAQRGFDRRRCDWGADPGWTGGRRRCDRVGGRS